MEQIQTHRDQTPFLYLANTDPMSIYIETVLSFSREGANSLGFKVEALSFTKLLALSKVETFQLNLGQDYHSTIIGDQRLYIAVNDEDDIYLTFSEGPTLKDNKFYFLGYEQHGIWPKSQQTCVMALFNDEPYAFNAWCETFLRPHTQPPLVLEFC
jgi:hypothetical protein